jgi:DNA-binding CsgD family transcriptional regulator
MEETDLARGKQDTVGQDPPGVCCCAAPHLTDRALDVLRCIAQGMSSTEVGAALGISPRTVDHHIGAMLRTTGARSRTDLVGLCYAAHILLPGLWPPRLSGRRCVRIAS